MAYLLRILLALMLGAVTVTILEALRFVEVGPGHIALAVGVFLFVIIVEAFVMFYFIGVSRLVDNVLNILEGAGSLDELFETPPADLSPYLKQVKRMHFEAKLAKRQTIPWAILTLTLGSIAFLLGGAYDTNLVALTTHSGLAYGFFVTLGIGFFRKWYYLGKTHRLLGKLKTLFALPRAQM